MSALVNRAVKYGITLIIHSYHVHYKMISDRWFIGNIFCRMTVCVRAIKRSGMIIKMSFTSVIIETLHNCFSSDLSVHVTVIDHCNVQFFSTTMLERNIHICISNQRSFHGGRSVNIYQLPITMQWSTYIFIWS